MEASRACFFSGAMENIGIWRGGTLMFLKNY
jgi:hypothetical protein